MAPRRGLEPRRNELFWNQQLADSEISYISRILLRRPHSYGIRTASTPDLVGRCLSAGCHACSMFLVSLDEYTTLGRSFLRHCPIVLGPGKYLVLRCC
jgi:hypothetical protein